jgi:hypothetical protein
VIILRKSGTFPIVRGVGAAYFYYHNNKANIMANEDKFSRETTIYVATTTKLNFEQTQSITNELLRIIGYPNSNPGFKFHFIEEGDLIQANASVDSDLKVSVRN